MTAAELTPPQTNVYDGLYDCLKQLGYVGSLEVIEGSKMTVSWIGKPGEGRDVEIKISILPLPEPPSPQTKPAPTNVFDGLYDCLKQLGYVGSLEVIESGRMTASWIGKPGEGRDVEIKVSISPLDKREAP